MRITFEDHGQDFITWKLDNNGVVVDCMPFQAFVWCGVRVELSRKLQVGDIVAFRRAGEIHINTIRYPVAEIEADLTPEAFNSQYPIGTMCRYYPVAGDRAHDKTRIRSGAWMLGHGAVVVKIKGRTGGVDINHLVMSEPE